MITIEPKLLFQFLGFIFLLVGMLLPSVQKNGLELKSEPVIPSLQLPVNTRLQEQPVIRAPRQSVKAKLPIHTRLFTVPEDVVGRDLYSSKDSVTGQAVVYYFNDSWDRVLIPLQ